MRLWQLMMMMMRTRLGWICANVQICIFAGSVLQIFGEFTFKVLRQKGKLYIAGGSSSSFALNGMLVCNATAIQNYFREEDAMG